MPRARHLNGSAAEVEAAFYDAFNRGDIDAMMLLWADDDDIVCIHPGGPRLHGYAAVRASWEALFGAAHVRIEPAQLHEVHNLMSAVHSVIEGAAMAGGEAAHLVATNAYLKTPRGWRMVLHHVSVAAGQAPMRVDAPSGSLH